MADQGITHELKTDGPVFKAVAQGRKTFEIRKDDRSFCVGDTLRLRETVHTGKDMSMHGMPLLYTGAEEVRTVSHILRGPQYGLADGWVIMSLEQKATPPADAALADALETLAERQYKIYGVTETPNLLRKAAAALRARPHAVAEGFALVPVEPTGEMLAAGAYLAGQRNYEDSEIRNIYQDMLAASQSATGGAT